ncbi:MAG: hypothetical protein CM15mP49_00060 [Actinomycetota bacterium]|nr:MAG: hypothetical protein CM15mP49_00060 [Actinomycetota bacterium]
MKRILYLTVTAFLVLGAWEVATTMLNQQKPRMGLALRTSNRRCAHCRTSI